MRRVIKILFGLGALAFLVIIAVTGGFVWEIWTSPHPPAQVPNETITVILTAASLMMLVVSLIVAGVAIGGSQLIKDWIKSSAEEEIETLSEDVEGSVTASLHHGVGVVFGRLSYGDTGYDNADGPFKDSKDDPYRVNHPDLLDMAIQETQLAIKYWPADSIELWRSRNNLCFLYALAHQYLGKHGDKAETAIRWAEQLKDYHGEKGEPEWMKTYLRVVAAFPTYFSRDEKKQAVIQGESLVSTLTGKRNIAQVEAHLDALKRTIEESTTS